MPKVCAITKPIVNSNQGDYFFGKSTLLAIRVARSAEIIFCNILMLTLLVLSADGRPSTGEELSADPSEYHGNLSVETVLKVQQCEKDSNTMELCMRCAKVTKSDFVYPMCCSNDDGIKDWCKEYVYFGIE
ncbi:uncharacterized protein [Drosophila takahashii]|uniref:uncharacterized protein isoform X1 n=2 Tax=Drosophila takahashii TaxID=29030 RepID=UPI003898E3A2